MDSQPSILVIDDEPDNFDVVETLLDSENYHLYYAPSGQQALNRLDNFQPDLILLDVMMPDLDGMEVCQRIKADPQWQAVPIIMVTALTDKEDLARCLATGADDLLVNPSMAWNYELEFILCCGLSSNTKVCRYCSNCEKTW